jgi:hypothetical protein
VLFSARTRELVAERSAKDLGEYLLKGITSPERLYQLLEPGLGQEFAPLRVLPVVPDRRLTRLGKRPAGAGIEQLAWETRARLPAIHSARRLEVSELALALDAAARTSAAARRFTAGIDRRALDRRARAYRSMSGTSRRAADNLAQVERQLSALDLVEARSLSLDQAARRPTPDGAELERATAELDSAVTDADAALETSARRTRRTLRRGIRRLGDEYLVTTFDETGIEHVKAFETMREARAFKLAVETVAEHKKPVPSGLYPQSPDNPYGAYGDAP